MLRKIVIIAALINLAACSGIRTTDKAFSAHAESFNILFLQIPPRDTQEKAMELVPQKATIKTVSSAPKDLTSVTGFINRLIGIDYTSIEGTINNKE